MARASLVAQMVKNPLAMWDTWIQSLGWEVPWRRGWRLTPVFLSGESPWTEEPGGLYSPWGRTESDTAEQLTLSWAQSPPKLLREKERRGCVTEGRGSWTLAPDSQV